MYGYKYRKTVVKCFSIAGIWDLAEMELQQKQEVWIQISSLNVAPNDKGANFQGTCNNT